jgi:hypothetical protein
MKKKKTGQSNNSIAFIDKVLLYISFFPIWGIVIGISFLLPRLLFIPGEHFISVTVVTGAIVYIGYLWFIRRVIRYLDS